MELDRASGRTKLGLEDIVPRWDCVSQEGPRLVCHTFKDSDMPQERPTAMVIGQRGCVPRSLRLPWLPFWELSSEFRALKKILLNLSSLP